MTWIRFFKASVFGLTRNLQKIGQNFLKERRNKDPTKLMTWIKSTERNRIKTRFQSIFVGLSILIRNLKNENFWILKAFKKTRFDPIFVTKSPFLGGCSQNSRHFGHSTRHSASPRLALLGPKSPDFSSPT